jgi:hypothetical protein
MAMRTLSSPERARRDSAPEGRLMSDSAPTFSREDAELHEYRRAAEEALKQLDWCIGYLQGIRKTKTSRVLARNRNFIRSELMPQD